MNRKHVYVGMSGGVDSSLTAALLVEQGYKVTGVYMKNWTQDLPGMKCPWADDLADAKRVAVKLGIDFKVFDFENDYRHKVVDYMIQEYKNGRTPNPDIMCNQEVKFKLFLESALEDGADMIATGHYARVGDCENTENSVAELPNEGITTEERSDISVFDEHLQTESSKAPGPLEDAAGSSFDKTIDEVSVLANRACLKKAVDENKDQTYFLYRVTGQALAKTLFPIGEYTKPQVREMAAARGLSTAAKKDSQGICFVGQIGIRDFIRQYVDQKPGNIIDKKTGKKLGSHEGAIFYTIGQRHGLDLGGGLPYYVVGKDMDKNEVYVTTDINDNELWKNQIRLQNIHWINDCPKNGDYQVRVRHRAKLVDAFIEINDDFVLVKFKNSEKAIAGGQSVVIYDGEIVLGGGIIA